MLALNKFWIAKSFNTTQPPSAEILQDKTDPDGHYVLLMLPLGTTIFTLMNVYVLTPFNTDLLHKLSILALDSPSGHLLLVTLMQC